MLSVTQVLDYLVTGPGGGAVTLFPITHGIIQSTLVGNGRMVALVPPGGLPASGERLWPEDLDGATLIVFEPQSVHGQMLSRFLDAGPVTPRKTHVVRFAETAIDLAEAGVGIAVVDEFSAASAEMAKQKNWAAEQIVAALRQIQVQMAQGKSFAPACKDAEISEQSYYHWRKEYGRVAAEQAKRLKDLEPFMADPS